MELKNLLSVVIAALTSFGAMLFAMGSHSTGLALALWLAAVVSLVVTDFFGVVRVPRKWASLVMWGVMAVFLPHFVRQPDWDNKLLAVASILLCLQIALLFQEKDVRVYGWLAVMSLLQVVVAARYSQGVVFGGLLITYAIVGIFALSLMVQYSQWEAALVVPLLDFFPPKGGTTNQGGTTSGRWPLAAMKSSFTSAAAGTGRSGVVGELFTRLALIASGALLLAGAIFWTVPRPHLPAWHGDSRHIIATVGFNDKIALEAMGETLENPQEVMQLKLVDRATQQVDPMRDDIYLRGSVVTWYSHNHWQRTAPQDEAGKIPIRPYKPSKRVRIALEHGEIQPPDRFRSDRTVFQVGPLVEQRISMEPYLERDDVFYVSPLVLPVGPSIFYSPQTGRLMRRPSGSDEPRGGIFKCEVDTSGLVEGHQAPLVPASEAVLVPQCLQLPGAPWPLPRLNALAARWQQESGLPFDKQYEIARSFEQKLSNSSQFQYTLQGPERDASIDAIEDFVSNNPRGHCEYFATALALMLRSVGIPSRVVLGYRCDEWHEDEQCYQVRQLHAHAWVEAYLEEDQIPAALRGSDRIDWGRGGWLRLDPTPAADLGTQAVQRTILGGLQARWHSLERYWDKYIVDMNYVKQRENVYEPIYQAARDFASRLFDPHWWKRLAARMWASLAALLPSGRIGWLTGILVLIAVSVLPMMAGWWLVRSVRRLWRRFAGGGDRRRTGAQSSIEFYRRFEQIVARAGLQRAIGQTPCEFACDVGTRLAAVSGRGELFAQAMQVVEAFYRVRFGRHALDALAAQSVEKALEDLAAGAEKPPPAK